MTRRFSANVAARAAWLGIAVLLGLSGCTPPNDQADSSGAAAEEEQVSRPGEYRGYSDAVYDGHQRTSRYVAVRDGTRLAIDIFRPTRGGEVAAEPLPVVWMHTPYNRRSYRGGRATALAYPGEALKLVEYGYVVAVADFRGLYASFGTNRGYNRGEWHPDARWDAYDITEWLAAQPWSNGRIGMWGCSATGGSQMQALATAPPHLEAIFPMSCEFDVYAFAVPGGLAPPPGIPSRIPRGGSREERDAAAVPVDGEDGRTLLDLAIAEHTDNVETAGNTPFRDSISETLGEPWWLLSSPHTYMDDIRRSGIAVYAAANWDEGATRHGAPFIFNNLQSAGNPAKLIIGPETHCNWAAVRDNSGFDIVVEERRFFDHWLKGIDNGVMEEAAVTYYTYNAPEGRRWRSAAAWPLPGETRMPLYFADGTLSDQPPEAPAGDTVTVRYETGEQAAISYTSEPLEADLEVTGHPVVNVWLGSSTSDADVIAVLEDIAPDGTATSYYMEGRLRASRRALAEPPYQYLGLPWHSHREADAAPLTPGEPVELAFEMLPMSYLFPAGHRLRVTVSFVDERATPKLDPPPEITVYRGGERASHIILPVIPPTNATAAAVAR